MNDAEKQVIQGYVDTLNDLKKMLAAKVGNFDGADKSWDAHSQGIHALVETNSFIDSAVEHLEVRSGVKEPEMRMPDGSPMPEEIKKAIIRSGEEDGEIPTPEQIEHAQQTGAYL